MRGRAGLCDDGQDEGDEEKDSLQPVAMPRYAALRDAEAAERVECAHTRGESDESDSVVSVGQVTCDLIGAP